MTKQIKIKQLTMMQELYQAQEVEEAVWKMSPIPVHQTFTVLNNGGIILGAFAGEKMIGFLYSFPGFDGEQIYLCSHMMGILPEYREAGLGKKLKLTQYDIAREKGYTMITWTYDPLESQNAYLNLHKLGSVGAIYKMNYYGNMTDKLNQGLRTDRFQIEWHLDDRTNERPKRIDEAKLLIRINEHGEPIVDLEKYNADGEYWFVPIPAYFQTIKQENIKLAKQWRRTTGEVFEKLFSHGYIAKDLIRNENDQFSYYYFSKHTITNGG